MNPFRDLRVTIPACAAVGLGMIATRPAPAAILSAVVAWPFVEYLFHRYAMHGLRSLVGERCYRSAHGIHHDRPRDLSHFAVPPFVVALVAIVLLAALPVPFVGSLLVCLAGYDLVHLGCHGVGPFRGRLPTRLVAHHARHHARDCVAFAVTTPAVDALLGTAPR